MDDLLVDDDECLPVAGASSVRVMLHDEDGPSHGRRTPDTHHTDKP